MAREIGLQTAARGGDVKESTHPGSCATKLKKPVGTAEI
jgi:hypothetical protein